MKVSKVSFSRASRKGIPPVGFRLEDHQRQDPTTAGYEAMAAASLAWNNGNPAAAFLDLVHLAISQGGTNPPTPGCNPNLPAHEQPPALAAPPSACKSA